MSLRVTPFLRLAVLCTRVEFDTAGRPERVVEPLHTISLTPDRFGKPLGEMALYVQMEDAVGEFDFSVRIEDETNAVTAQPNLKALSHRFGGPDDPRIVPFELVLSLFGLVFPGPGVYHLIVRCDTAPMHVREGAARAPLLRVLST